MTLQLFIFLLFLTLLVVPAALIAWLWRRRSKTKLDWFLRLSVTAIYLLWIWLGGVWTIVSLHLRWAWLAALIAAAVISFRRAREAPYFMRSGMGWWLSLGGRVLLVAGLLLMAVPRLQGQRYTGEALTIASPLRGGRYVVDHGGSDPSINHHSESSSPQEYALDIVRVDALGIRARGVFPRQLERYEIFGDTVYSPLSGTIAAAVDGLPDLIPPEVDSDRIAGNHVWIRAGNVYLLLAHLKNGSLRVRPGERVKAGAPLGQIGNSGNTTEPHLHMHAVRIDREVSPDKLERRGAPVPLLIEGRFLTRNSTF